MKFLSKALHFLYRFMIYILALIGLGVVVGLFVLTRTLSDYIPDFKEPIQTIKPQTVLTIELGDEPLSEGMGNFSFQSFLSNNLQDLVTSIYKAAHDNKVKGILFNIRGNSISLAQAQELHEVLTYFKQKGKFIYVHAQSIGEMSNGTSVYCLASIADAIYLQPQGRVNLIGYMAEVPFYRDLMDEWSIEPHILKREVYKNAPHSYLYSGFTESHREHTRYIVERMFNQAIHTLAKQKNLKEDKVAQLIHNGPYLDNHALGLGLIQGIEYFSDTITRIEKEKCSGHKVNLMDVKHYHYASSTPTQHPVIAVIHLEGDITSGNYLQEGSDGYVIKALDKALKDPSVRGIIIRINTGGGSSTASESMYGEILKASHIKPIVISMSEAAASGGYLAACGAPYIIAHPATLTGSIGVYGGKINTSLFWKQFGVNWESVKSGSHASIYSSGHGYTPYELSFMNMEMDQIYLSFKAKVAKGRKLPLPRVDHLAQGHVWLGQDAKEFGLVDELGGYLTAIRYLKKILKMRESDEIQLKSYPQLQIFEKILGLFLDYTKMSQDSLNFVPKNKDYRTSMGPLIIDGRLLSFRKIRFQEKFLKGLAQD